MNRLSFNLTLCQISLRQDSSYLQDNHKIIFIQEEKSILSYLSTNAKTIYPHTSTEEPDDDGDTTQAKMADQYYFDTPRSRGLPDAAV